MMSRLVSWPAAFVSRVAGCEIELCDSVTQLYFSVVQRVNRSGYPLQYYAHDLPFSHQRPAHGHQPENKFSGS